MEDLLTSDVFSAMKYLPPELLFIPFIQLSIDKQENDISIRFDGMKKIEYHFWPIFELSEPDVLIHIEYDDGSHFVIVIEAKYLSGKSGDSLSEEEMETAKAPVDQLAREYKDLLENAAGYIGIEALSEDDVALVYVTANNIIPKKELHDSLKEIQATLPYLKEVKMFWNTWYNVQDIAKTSLESNNQYQREILKDLIELMEKKRLTHFNGIRLQNIGDIQRQDIYNMIYQIGSYNISALNWSYEVIENGDG